MQRIQRTGAGALYALHFADHGPRDVLDAFALVVDQVA